MPIINSSFTSQLRGLPKSLSLIDFLSQRFFYHTREEWKALIHKGRLSLDDQLASAEDILKNGQSLRFQVVDYFEPDLPCDFKIVTQNQHLMLVHKPAGLPVHRTGKIFFQTLANLIREHLKDQEWSPLNRLDRDTSGLVAFAKGKAAASLYSPQNVETHWSKIYVAVIRGDLPKGLQSTSLPLKENVKAAIRSKMEVDEEGKVSHTLWQKIASENGYSLVVLSPLTGRKHQLRAHLAALGYPMVGDKMYAHDGIYYLKQLNAELSAEDFSVLGAHRHLLHSCFLNISLGKHSMCQAWDWDWPEEFTHYFEFSTWQNWMTSAAGDTFKAQVWEARNINP